MNSRDKLNQLVHKAQTTEPDSEESARLAQMITVAVPLVAPMIPDDPAELDAQLLALANLALSIRSDGAEPAVELAAVSEPGVGAGGGI